MNEINNIIIKIKKASFRKIIYKLNNDSKILIRVFKYIRL